MPCCRMQEIPAAGTQSCAPMWANPWVPSWTQRLLEREDSVGHSLGREEKWENTPRNFAWKSALQVLLHTALEQQPGSSALVKDCSRPPLRHFRLLPVQPLEYISGNEIRQMLKRYIFSMSAVEIRGSTYVRTTLL